MFGKSWLSMRKHQRVSENFLKLNKFEEKVWESVLKVEKLCQKYRKSAKSWECMIL